MLPGKPVMNQTKVNLPPPPKPRTNRLDFLQQLPAAAEEKAPANLAMPSTTRAADLNFKVAEEFHRAFKAAATLKGISMKELLEEAFQLWAERNDLQHVAKDVAAGVVQERSRGRIERVNELEATGQKRRQKARKPEKSDLFRGG